MRLACFDNNVFAHGAIIKSHTGLNRSQPQQPPVATSPSPPTTGRNLSRPPQLEIGEGALDKPVPLVPNSQCWQRDRDGLSATLPEGIPDSLCNRAVAGCARPSGQPGVDLRRTPPNGAAANADWLWEQPIAHEPVDRTRRQATACLDLPTGQQDVTVITNFGVHALHFVMPHRSKPVGDSLRVGRNIHGPTAGSRIQTGDCPLPTTSVSCHSPKAATSHKNPDDTFPSRLTQSAQARLRPAAGRISRSSLFASPPFPP